MRKNLKYDCTHKMPVGTAGNLVLQKIIQYDQIIHLQPLLLGLAACGGAIPERRRLLPPDPPKRQMAIPLTTQKRGEGKFTHVEIKSNSKPPWPKPAKKYMP